MQTRLIVNLCDQDMPDVVIQLRASHVAVIAEALAGVDAEDLATAFRSLQRMLVAGEDDLAS